MFDAQNIADVPQLYAHPIQNLTCDLNAVSGTSGTLPRTHTETVQEQDDGRAFTPQL